MRHCKKTPILIAHDCRYRACSVGVACTNDIVNGGSVS